MEEKRVEESSTQKKYSTKQLLCVVCGVCGEETVTVVVGWDRYILFFYKKIYLPSDVNLLLFVCCGFRKNQKKKKKKLLWVGEVRKRLGVGVKKKFFK